MDEAAQQLAREWLTRADHDLRSARVLAHAQTICDFVLNRLPKSARP